MATDVMRPSSIDCHQEWSDPKVGDNYIAPGLANSLQSFYTKASPSDREKCMRLLTNFDSNKTALHRQVTPHYPDPKPPRRPKTAMASINTDRRNAYITKYTKEYTPPPLEDTTAIRPPSTQAFQAPHDLSGPIGNTTYDQEYFDKELTTAQPIRTGTASGDRRNNPHPTEGFLYWRLPHHVRAQMSGPQLTSDDLDKVCRGYLRSTYQSDYMGIPQGMRPNTAGDLPSNWRENVPYSLQSDMRRAYPVPASRPSILTNNKTRYGCNSNKQKPSMGVVPNYSERYLHIKPGTTYEREYFNRESIKDKSHGKDPMFSYDLGNNGDAQLDMDNDYVSRLIRRTHSSHSGSRSPASSLRRSPGYNCGKPSSPNLSWTSTWMGPH